MKHSRKTDEAATTRKGCERTKRSAGSRAAGGWTRRKLVQWATARLLTSELKRLKESGDDLKDFVQRLRLEKNGNAYEVERLKKQLDNCYDGNRRWRAEAQKLAKWKDAVESAIAQASNDQAQRRAVSARLSGKELTNEPKR